MKPRKSISEAIVLARRNYQEADRLVVLYTKDSGKMSFLAKGVRRPKSRKRGALEVFSRIKYSASLHRSGLGFLEEVQLIDQFKKIRKDLKRSSLAFYMVEVVGRMSTEGEKNLELYNLLVQYLSRLEVTDKFIELKNQFIQDQLTLLGFWPKGKKMLNHEEFLESILEREINSKSVAKKILH